MSALTSLLSLPIGWPWDSKDGGSNIWPGLALPAEEPTYEPISWLPVIVGSVTVCWVLPYLILRAFEDPVHAEDVVRRISEVHIPSLVKSASGKLFTAQGSKIYRATCDLSGTSVFGRVELTQVEGVGWTTISYEVTGLKPGPHGFSIHESGEGLSMGDGFASAGPHFNPFNKKHGAPNDMERHVGGMGNIVADSHGVAKGEIVDHLIKLNGKLSVVGRSVIVHADADDLGQGGDPGNAGARLAGGAIKALPTI